jgi:sporulation-control protein
MDILSRVGIGSASVDTKVPSTVTAGETIEAVVEIEGGSSEQTVESIHLALETRYEKDEGRGTGVVEKYRLTDGFTIEPGEEWTETVSLEIPRHTPITVGRTDVWFETGLDIDWALDPDDTDYVEVQPTDRMDRVFAALEELGLELRTAYPESASSGPFSGGRVFVQEFEFVPSGGPYRGDLDELEVVFEPTDGALDVLLEVDRRGGLLTEMSDLGIDERFERLTVADQSTAEIVDQFRMAIDRNV